MNRNPTKRLGYGPNGVKEIKEHAFFNDLDWNLAESK